MQTLHRAVTSCAGERGCADVEYSSQQGGGLDSGLYKLRFYFCGFWLSTVFVMSVWHRPNELLSSGNRPQQIPIKQETQAVRRKKKNVFKGETQSDGT